MDGQPPLPLDPKLKVWHGLAVFMAAVAFQILFGIVLQRLFYALGAMQMLFSPAVLTFQVVITSSAMAALAVFASSAGGKSAIDLMGFRRPSIAMAVIAVMGIIPFGILADEITFALHTLAPFFFEAKELLALNGVVAGASSFAFICFAFAVTVGPALGEEMLCRGLMLKSFKSGMPTWAALVLSSALFGVLHLIPLQSASAFVLGLYLGLIVILTKSIWPAVFAHAINNLYVALSVRFDPEGVGKSFMEGHTLTELIVASILATAMISLLIIKRKT